MKKFFKIAGIALLIILVLVIIVVIIVFLYIKGKLNKINYVEIDEEKLNISETAEGNLEEYRNIVLLGLDNRIQDDNITYDNEGSRTDCIIIASINKETNDVKLISVYRDTFVDIDGYGLDNINNAYTYGGPELTIATLNKNFDLNIKEFVAVNFTAVAEMVDSVGGVEIDITSEELKYINDYINGLGKDSGLSSENINKSGLQTLNGVQAVAYSRIRYTDGGDYKRTERMRTVLLKIFEKLKNMSVSELNKIADDMLPEVYTNIRSNEVLEMIPEIAKFNVTESIGWPYAVDGVELEDGLWHGIPRTLESNVKLLHENIFNEDNYEVNETIKSISERMKEVYDYEGAAVGT